MLVDALMQRVRVAARTTLDALAQKVWQNLHQGLLSEEDAQAIAEEIERRRHPATRAPTKPKRCRVRSVARRRHRAAAGPLPPSLAHLFTIGELAVLHVIAGEIVRSGCCRLTVGQIAAEAGVGETTMRQARRTAVEAGLMTCKDRRIDYCRSDPNELRIVSPEWLLWLKRGRARFLDAHVQNNIILEERAGTEWRVSASSRHVGPESQTPGEGSLGGSSPARPSGARSIQQGQELVPQKAKRRMVAWPERRQDDLRSQRTGPFDPFRVGRSS